MNLLAALFDFLDNRPPTVHENAVRVSSKLKRQWDVARAVVRSAMDLGSEPRSEHVYFAEFASWFLVEDMKLEDDEFLVTSLEKVKDENA